MSALPLWSTPSRREPFSKRLRSFRRRRGTFWVLLGVLLWGASPLASPPLAAQSFSDTGPVDALEIAPATAASRKPSAPRAESPSKAALVRALDRYQNEPGVSQVVAEAIRHGGFGAERARGLIRRSRASGILPDVKLGVRRHDGRRRSEQSLIGDPVRLTSDAGLTFEASVSFELGRLVYGRDEVALERHRRRLRQDREETTRLVVELYYLRRRLQLERDLAGSTVDGSMRLAEAQALLDAMTGGAFEQLWLP